MTTAAASPAEWEPGEQREPWLRQPRESGKAYAAFLAYRDLGPGRSVVLFAERHGVKYETAKKQAQRGDWNRRAAAWDAFMQRTRDSTRAALEQRQRDQQTDLAHRLAMRYGKSLASLPEQAVDQVPVRERLAVATHMGRLHHQLTTASAPAVQVNTTVNAAAQATATASAAPGPDEREQAMHAATVELFRRAGIAQADAENAAAHVDAEDILALPEFPPSQERP
jgi:hypothetical protein